MTSTLVGLIYQSTLGFYLSPSRGVQEVTVTRIFEERASHNGRVYWMARISVADRLTGSKLIDVPAKSVYRDTPENRAAFSRLVELEREITGLRKEFYSIHDRIESFDPLAHRKLRDDVVEKYTADMAGGNWTK